MNENVTSLCPEQNNYASGDSLNITKQQEESANFEPSTPLNYGAEHIIVEQQNTGVDYDIPGVGTRTSKRFWAGEFDGDELVSLRTIGVSSLRGIAFEEKTSTSQAAPIIEAVQRSSDKSWHAAAGSYKVRALDDTSFIKGENLRYVVTKAVTVIPQRRATVFTAQYKDGALVVKSDKCGVDTNDRFIFFTKGEDPSADKVKKVLDAIKKDAQVEKHFYARKAN